MIRLMVLASFFMLMEMYMKVSGERIRLMERVLTLMLTVRNIKETGVMTNSMVSVLRDGPMAQYMKVNISRVRRTEKESSLSQMDLFTTETLR